MGGVFRLLARMKGLRGSRLDLSAWLLNDSVSTHFRDQVEAMLMAKAARLDGEDLQAVEGLLDRILDVRGFGHVKEAALNAAMAELESLSPASAETKRTPRPAGWMKPGIITMLGCFSTGSVVA